MEKTSEQGLSNGAKNGPVNKEKTGFEFSTNVGESESEKEENGRERFVGLVTIIRQNGNVKTDNHNHITSVEQITCYLLCHTFGSY